MIYTVHNASSTSTQSCNLVIYTVHILSFIQFTMLLPHRLNPVILSFIQFTMLLPRRLNPVIPSFIQFTSCDLYSSQSQTNNENHDSLTLQLYSYPRDLTLGHTRTHTTVLLLFWNMSGTTRVSRHQKGKNRKVKTNLDSPEQEIVSGSGICRAIYKSAPHSRQPRQQPTTQFLQAGCPSCRPTNSVKALKAKDLGIPVKLTIIILVRSIYQY